MLLKNKIYQKKLRPYCRFPPHKYFQTLPCPYYDLVPNILSDDSPVRVWGIFWRVQFSRAMSLSISWQFIRRNILTTVTRSRTTPREIYNSDPMATVRQIWIVWNLSVPSAKMRHFTRCNGISHWSRHMIFSCRDAWQMMSDFTARAVSYSLAIERYLFLIWLSSRDIL